MKNYLLLSLFLLIIITTSCMQRNRDNTMTQTLYLASSTDGLTFTDEKVLLERAGAPNLVIDKTGRLILTIQYFPEDTIKMFNTIAYMISEDNGKTWSEPTKVDIEGLPDPVGGPEGISVPLDPALVKLGDDSLRLYFTYQVAGQEFPGLAAGQSKKGTVEGTFTYEEISYVGKEPEVVLLDPTIIFFNGDYHHYTWQQNRDANIHMISKMGLIFQQKDDIFLPMNMLGSVLYIENGLRFYGTQNGNIVSATSEDGYTWVMEEGIRTQGGDPAVHQLPGGSYLMVFVR